MEVALRNLDEDPSDVAKFNLVKDAIVRVPDIQIQQNIMLKQKSRNKWLLEGSSNSSFFHNSIQTRRSHNTISELVAEDGTIITKVVQLRDHVVSYYEAKFNGVDLPIEDELFNYDHLSIIAEERVRLDLVPSFEEIKQAVFDLDADSAPGPGGFSGCFYSLIILLAKEKGANTLRKFRPIGFSNFFFKIFTKILGTRLGTILDNLVSEEQVAFMKGRNIHENISLASEMVNELQIKCKDGNLGLKLNISQAFDTVSWSFVLEVFRRYGFSENWCSLILHILQSTRISILFNGNPEGFKINRGLRQGDPLSPLIFVLIEDVLSRNITKIFQTGQMSYIVSAKGISPTHLFFADDIMFFCKGNMKSVKNLVDLLGSYQRSSGQTVCRQKSSRRKTITDFLGMSLTTFPDRFLGVQVMPGAVCNGHISPIIDKIKDHLSI
ncbi:uncharacterized protein LOC113356656 [Papaver somniferum]|uniref:uncharacterized protein LOC113356656 n=1 Tax=Papaver somniferum TaxID=3469 RepID=UPI000E6F6949|nr:uncharacterized protein LOC113356656 [Papaver somniferum]